MKESAEEREYAIAHQSLGCRLHHMVGIPMLIASLPIMLLSPLAGQIFFVGGLVHQIAGHLIYEGNFPAIINSGNPLKTMWVAIKFVYRDWKRLITTGMLMLCLLCGLPAQAKGNVLVKLGKVSAKVTWAVVGIPFRVPSYLKEVWKRIKTEIYIDEHYKMMYAQRDQALIRLEKWERI